MSDKRAFDWAAQDTGAAECQSRPGQRAEGGSSGAGLQRVLSGVLHDDRRFRDARQYQKRTSPSAVCGTFMTRLKAQR